jgi:hypothetical protein
VTAGNILLGQYAEMQDPGTNLLLNSLLVLLLLLLLLVFPGCWAVFSNARPRYKLFVFYLVVNLEWFSYMDGGRHLTLPRYAEMQDSGTPVLVSLEWFSHMDGGRHLPLPRYAEMQDSGTRVQIRKSAKAQKYLHSDFYVVSVLGHSLQ